MANGDFITYTPDPAKTLADRWGLAMASVRGTSLAGRTVRSVRVSVSHETGCDVEVAWGEWHAKAVHVDAANLRKLAEWTLKALDALEQREHASKEQSHG